MTNHQLARQWMRDNCADYDDGIGINCALMAEVCADALDIYDDDDTAARQSIRNYFHLRRYEPNCSVLTNLFRCYEDMMQQVTSRYMMLMA